MAANSNITITLVLQDKATAGMKKATQQVQNFRNEIKQFNRNLFTAAALIATFGIAFKKLTDVAKSGASFEYIRKQFAEMFKPEYLFKLQEFSRGTVDALTTMQEAIKMKMGGVKADYMENIFKMAPGFAKVLGKNPADVVKELGDAFRTANQRLLQTYLTTLKVNNQFQIGIKLNNQTTKSYGSAAMNWNTFSRIAMNELMQKQIQLNKGTEDSLEIFMQYSAQAKSLKDQFGELVARGVNPLVKAMSRVTGTMFQKLYMMMTDTKQKVIRNGLIDLTRHVIMFSGALIGLVAGFSAFSILLAPLGFTLTGIAGVLTIALSGLKAFRNEGESWGKTFANMGTTLQMFWEAFNSFDSKTGKATFSGDVYERFKAFPKQSRDNIWGLIKALITLKETLIGVGKGFMYVVDSAGALIAKVGGLFGWSKGKQTTKGWLSGAENIGKILGGAAAVGLILKGISTIGGGAFGLGKRGMSPLLPLFVSDVGAAAGGILGKLGFMGKAGLVGLAGAAGYGVGTLLDNMPKWLGMDRSYSDAISDWMVSEDRKRHGDFSEDGIARTRGSYKSAMENTAAQTDFASSADMSSMDPAIAEEIARSNGYLKQLVTNSQRTITNPKDSVFLPQ